MPKKLKKPVVTIVVPTIREASINRFLTMWQKEFFDTPQFDVTLILVEDQPKKTFSLAVNHKNIIRYTWEDIDDYLGAKSWIIPRHSDCIRSFGYLKAWQTRPDMIVTLDDDCYPSKVSPNFLADHYGRLTQPYQGSQTRWVSTIETYRPRGLPYAGLTLEKTYAPPILNHGLWENVLDFDATTQLALPKSDGYFDVAIDQLIPKDTYFPMCGMNLAWRPELTPIMYFLLMGETRDGTSWHMDRFGDIWAGIFAKKIIDHLGFTASSGKPIVWHDRASDAQVNFNKEKNGKKTNELLWRAVDSVQLTSDSIALCYLELSAKLVMHGEYWSKVRQAMQIWANLFT